MHRHAGHGVGVRIELVDTGHEGGRLQEVIERRESDFAAFVGHDFRRTGDEFPHVLNALLPFGPFGTQVVGILDRGSEITQQLIDGRVEGRGAQPLHERHEIGEGRTRGGAQLGHDVGARRDRKQRHAFALRALNQKHNRGLAEAALGHVHGTTERLVVSGIRDQLEVRHDVADLATIVEAHGADKTIRDIAAAERVFERAALCIGAVEHCAVAPRKIGARHARGDRVSNEVGLVALIERLDERDRLPRRSRGAQRLAAPLGVLGDHRVGERENVRRGAVVLFEAYDARTGKGAFEVEDVADIGAAPPVDGLIVVTDDHHVAIATAHELHEAKLRGVRILVLVNEHVLETTLIVRPQCFILLERAYGQDQQVVERDSVGLLQSVLEIGVHAGHGRRERVARGARILARRNERILGARDRAENRLRRELGGTELSTLHDALHGADRVVFVVNCKVRLPPHTRGNTAQHARAEGVEGAAPHAFRFVAEELGDAGPHLAGRLIGERDRQNFVRGHAAIADESGDARGEHAGFAGTRTGEHQRRAVFMKYGFALTRIEASRERFEIERRCRRHRVKKGTGPTRRRHPFKITSNAAPRSVSASTSLPS